MKDLFLAAIVLTILIAFSLGTKENTLSVASTKQIVDLLATCKLSSVTDNITEDELADYLLNCVNEQLARTEHHTIAKLPTTVS